MHIWLWNKNEYVLRDNPFWFTEDEGEFYSFDRFQNDLISDDFSSNESSVFFLLSEISISEEIEIYERTVFSFLDLTGQFGGIYELLEVTAAFFVGYYNTKIFNFELVKSINNFKHQQFVKSQSREQCHNENENSKHNEHPQQDEMPNARLIRNK